MIAPTYKSSKKYFKGVDKRKGVIEQGNRAKDAKSEFEKKIKENSDLEKPKDEAKYIHLENSDGDHYYYLRELNENVPDGYEPVVGPVFGFGKNSTTEMHIAPILRKNDLGANVSAGTLTGTKMAAGKEFLGIPKGAFLSSSTENQTFPQFIADQNRKTRFAYTYLNRKPTVERKKVQSFSTDIADSFEHN